MQHQRKKDSIVASAFYYTEIWQTMYELPIMTHINWSFEKHAGPMCSPGTFFMMRNEEEYTIIDESFVEKKILAEDIPLVSVKEVIKNAETEIEAGHIQKVMSLRFGYVVYNDPTIANKRMSARDVENWYLVPAWVLECRYSANPKKNYDERENPKLIIINAQTGKVHDPLDKSVNGHGDSRYKGFIPWDKVK